MKSILFDDAGHLTEKSINAFKDGSLDDESLLLISEHIADCERCANAISDSFDNTELAKAPLGFEEDIQSKIKSKKKSIFEFRIYSLKVAMAACIALMIVFSNGLNFISDTVTQSISIKAPDLKGVNSISTRLNNFSQRIVNMEVNNNEKEKK